MNASQAVWFCVVWAAASVLVSAAVIVFVCWKISDIDDRTESDLCENFPSTNPQPPAESTQETAASTASR